MNSHLASETRRLNTPTIIDLTDYTTFVEAPQIIRAEYLGECSIGITFSDRTHQTVDFKPFLERTKDRTLKKYLQPAYFQHYVIFNGNLNWDDYDMIFPIEDLYTNTI